MVRSLWGRALHLWLGRVHARKVLAQSTAKVAWLEPAGSCNAGRNPDAGVWLLVGVPSGHCGVSKEIQCTTRGGRNLTTACSGRRYAPPLMPSVSPLLTGNGNGEAHETTGMVTGVTAQRDHLWFFVGFVRVDVYSRSGFESP